QFFPESLAMTIRLALAALVIGFCSGVHPARGATVVVANRTVGEVRFAVTPPQGKAQQYAVPSGDLAAIPVTGAAEIAFDSGTARRQYQVAPNSAYYFAHFASGLVLKEIGLAAGEDRHGRPPEAPWPPA